MDTELFTISPETDFEDHAHFSPSGLMYRELCPRWEREKTGDSEASKEGTALHKAVETRTLTGLDKEQVESVNKCILMSDTILKRATPVHAHHKERRLLIGQHPETRLFLTFGTADEVIESRLQRHVFINDWKFGRRSIVPAEINLQGVSYAVGAFEEWNWADWVTVTFAIPRRDEVTTHTFKRSEYPVLLLRVYASIEQSANYLPARFSPQACEFCANRIHCSEVKDNLFKTMSHYDATVSIWKTAMDNVHSSQVKDPAVMSAMLKVAEVASKWVDSVKHHANKLVMDDGVNIPDYEMRMRTVSSRDDDGAKLYSALKHLFTPEEFITACRVSKTRIEEIVSERAPKGQKKAAVQALNEALADAGLVGGVEKTTTYLARLK